MCSTRSRPGPTCASACSTAPSSTPTGKRSTNTRSKVDEQIDLLVNYTAGDGFIYRQTARATVARDLNLNIAGTVLALLLSALVAWALARRIVRPVAVASNVAERIATGKLDVVIPKGSADELGALARLHGADARQHQDNDGPRSGATPHRASAPRRRAGKFAGRRRGGRRGQLHRAGQFAQAADFLGVPADLLKPGTPLAELQPAFEDSESAGRVLLWRDGDPQATGEVLLADGRWLRISHSATRDQGFIVVCSDISLSKKQEANLRQTNRRLDAALDNMSQGLCLFDAQNRLEVVNRRFFEIFGLSRDKIQPGTTFREILELSVASQNHGGKTVDELLAEQADFMRRHANGTHFYELSGGRVVACAYNTTSDGGWVATYEDVTERRQAEAKIMHMARHDALTNLPNRVLFREKMEQALARGEKARGAVHRSRPLQERQRHARTSGRRRAAVRGDQAPANGGARRRHGGAARRRRVRHHSARRAADRRDRACGPHHRLDLRIVRRPRAIRSSSAPASASPSRRPTATNPTSFCATPTWRSIAPRAKAAAPITSSSRKWTRRCRRATVSNSICARRWSPASSSSTTSRWSISRPTRSAASKRWCAGTIRSAAWSRRTISFRWRRKSA